MLGCDIDSCVVALNGGVNMQLLLDILFEITFQRVVCDVNIIDLSM